MIARGHVIRVIQLTINLSLQGCNKKNTNYYNNLQ